MAVSQVWVCFWHLPYTEPCRVARSVEDPGSTDLWLLPQARVREDVAALDVAAAKMMRACPAIQ